MNRKLITIAIALIILAIVIAPVAAKLPAKNPFPKGAEWDTLWTLLKDLQTQIRALITRVNDITSRVGDVESRVSDIESNPVHFGEWYWGPDGPGYPTSNLYEMETPYTAPTDGIVVFHGWENSATPHKVKFYARTYTGADVTGHVPRLEGVVRKAEDSVDFTLPVRKGDNWVITSYASPGVDIPAATDYNIYWIPLTS